MRQNKRRSDEFEVLEYRLDDFDVEEPEDAVERDDRKRSSRKKRSGRKKSKMKTWQKVLIGIVTALVLIVVGLAGTALALHKSGEAKIKKAVKTEKLTASGEKEDVVYSDGKAYKYRENTINILCLGVDKQTQMAEEEQMNSMGQSDAIFILSLDQDNKRMRLLAIPRDTMVEVSIFDTADRFVRKEVQQITLQYAYGDGQQKSCELVRDVVSKLCYGLPIQKYCSVNLRAIPIMNDRIGGVPVYLDESIINWFPGSNVGDMAILQGEQALEYVRQRNEDVFASSMSRLSRQKEYVLSFANTAKAKLSEDMTLPVGLFNDLQGNIYTDVAVEEITYLATQVLGMSFGEEDLRMIPGETTMGEKYEEYHVNEEDLKRLILEMFYDEVQAESSSY